MACLVVYLATCCAWDDCLALGERGLALFMAPTADQATVAFDYACALVEGSPILSALVVKRIADTLELILKLRGDPRAVIRGPKKLSVKLPKRTTGWI